MKIGMKACAIAVALSWGSSALAQTAPTITVTPYLALNAFGSPNYNAQIANQNAALLAGQTSAGTPGTAAYYQAQSNIFTTDLMVTNFAYYRGTADPAAPYASELGTRGAFGVFINGNGGTFSISALSLNVVGTGDVGDPAAGNYATNHYLDFARAAGTYNYGDGYVGVLFGADGVLGGGDDTYVTSGPNTQLVNALVGRGSGTAYSVLCGNDPNVDFGPCGADNQSYITEAAEGYPFPSTFTGTYSLNGASGSGSFTVSAPAAVPEPATWGMMLLGFGVAGAALRRRRIAATRVSYAG